MKSFMILYGIVSILLACINCVIAYRAYNQRTRAGRCFAGGSFMAAVVSITYMLSTFQTGYRAISALSSIYFFSIDIMLIFMITFVLHYTENYNNKTLYHILFTFMLYGAIEGIIFMINPFCEIAISYTLNDEFFACFQYQMHPLYYVHLIYTYLMSVFFVVLIVWKMVRVPHEYKQIYRMFLVSFAFIILMNFSFLFVKLPSVLGSLDLSVLAYSIGLMLLYWSSFVYPESGLLNYLRSTVIESIDRGVVLFRFDNKRIMINDVARKMLPASALEEDISISDFLYECQLKIMLDDENIQLQSIQCYLNDHPTRCDYRIVRNSHNEIMGRLFVFTNVTLESDLLTGFHHWDQFRAYYKEQKRFFDRNGAVAILDINGLAMINSSRGRSYGDQCIQQLADLMRRFFPSMSYFVRGEEANLIVLCADCTEKDMTETIREIEMQFEHNIQYSVAYVDISKTNAVKMIEECYQGLRTKKLMDKNSSHSNSLTSLIQALQGCDTDTEEHVKRTQRLGELLGKRIGLTDTQLSHLSLLCILHDIGKIGIPLDILNKPGKLTEQEWHTIQSHVGKGYEIANSTSEFSQIAPMIRHHHERWDGKGYPDGLSRESIPLLSRVIAVVDAYDAMVNNRSYRKALPYEVAVEEIRKNAGTQFDPYIASEFLQMLEINRSYKKPQEQQNTEKEGDIASDAPLSIAKEQALQNVHMVTFCRYVADANLIIVDVDDHFENLTGYNRQDLAERKLTQFDLLPEQDRAEYISMVTSALANQPSAYFEHRILRKDGTIIYVFCYGKMFYDSAAREQRSEIIVTRMLDFYSVRTVADEERNRVQNQMAQWETTSRKDSLTGLFNRRAFISDVEEHLLRKEEKVLFLMIDVDKFKEYNDAYGHQAGDEYLTLIGHTLSNALRKDDLACRMGGDEFAAALFFAPTCTDQLMYDRAKQVFDKINMLLTAQNTQCSISMGVAISSERWDSFKKLYKASDDALYRAKEQGRGCLKIQFSESEVQKTKEEGKQRGENM